MSGLRDWLRQFAPAFPEAEYGRVEEAARAVLFRDGRWSADYRRIRVVAVKG